MIFTSLSYYIVQLFFIRNMCQLASGSIEYTLRNLMDFLATEGGSYNMFCI